MGKSCENNKEAKERRTQDIFDHVLASHVLRLNSFLHLINDRHRILLHAFLYHALAGVLVPPNASKIRTQRSYLLNYKLHARSNSYHYRNNQAMQHQLTIA